VTWVLGPRQTVRWPSRPGVPGRARSVRYAGLRHSRGGCRAGPGRPSVTDPARHPPRRVTDWSGVPSSVGPDTAL